ncbi:MAG: glycosyltransferase [Kiritimatiellae bacterium]|nr:glycosyltransferase [Kiritimatiellia bacterium]
MNEKIPGVLPSVTAVISTHNRCEDLRKTLAMLRSLDYPALRIHVVDNASTDDTRCMVKAEFPDVDCFPHSFNRPMDGYNIGFERSRSSYVLVLDDDSCPRPGVLEEMVAHLERHPDMGAAAGNILDLDGSSEWAPYDEVTYSSQWNNLIGCGFLIRRAVLTAAQGYRENFDLYYNDLDLALCILAQGFCIAFHRDWIVDHRKAPSNRVPNKKTHMMIRNYSWIVRSHFKGWTRWNLLVGHALILLRQAARAGCLAPSLRYLFSGLFSRLEHPVMPVPASPAAARFVEEYALTANLKRLFTGRADHQDIPNEDLALREVRPAPTARMFQLRKKTERPPVVCYWEQRMVYLDLMVPRDETTLRMRRKEDRRIGCDCAQRMAWYRGTGHDYQRWLMKCSYLSCMRRARMQREVEGWRYQPLISILTPMHHVLTDHFQEMLLSIERQLYANWQFCVVDDGSQRQDLRQAIQSFSARHPGKVRFVFRNENKGICATEQEVLSLAEGEFVALLDHDDRLAPEALFEMVKRLNEKPATDWLYSDMDKISPEGDRCLHFFKPDWSPNLLDCCNYVLHLSVIRRSLLEEIGGFTMGCDGAQDFDLYLRVAEKTNRVEHIAKVLYSFRQSAQSTAADLNAKPEIYEHGRAALQRSMERRGLEGTVEHNTLAWSGHYWIQRPARSRSLAELLVGPEEAPPMVVSAHTSLLQTLRCGEAGIGQALKTLLESGEADYVLIRDASVTLGAEALDDLLGQLDVPGLAGISPKILLGETVDHCGPAVETGGRFFFPLRGQPATEAAYGAAGVVARNVSLLSPLLAVIRREALDSVTVDAAMGLGALPEVFFALRDAGYRLAVDGRVTAQREGDAYEWPSMLQPGGEEFSILLRRRPTQMTCGDPYYNRNLHTAPPDYGGRDIL